MEKGVTEDFRKILYEKPYRRILWSTPQIIATWVATNPTIGRIDMNFLEVPFRMTLQGVILKWGAACAGNVYVVLYRDNGNTPAGGARLAVSNSVAKAGVSRNQYVPFVTPVRVRPGPYWIGLESDEAASNIYYCVGSLDAADVEFRRAYADLGAYAIPPDPCPAVNWDQYPRWMAAYIQSIP